MEPPISVFKLSLLKLKSIPLEFRMGKLLKRFFLCQISMPFFLSVIPVTVNKCNSMDKQMYNSCESTWSELRISFSLILYKWNRDSIFLSLLALPDFTNETI